MTEGLTWDWETYPEYLDAIERRPRDIDFASQIPHSAVRVYAMGERGANREPATPEDLERMQAIVREAIGVGALGFATSRLVIHKTGAGRSDPHLHGRRGRAGGDGDGAEGRRPRRAAGGVRGARSHVRGRDRPAGPARQDQRPAGQLLDGAVERQSGGLEGRDAAPGRGQRVRPADPGPGLPAPDRRRPGLRPIDQPVQPLPELAAAGQAAVRRAHRRAARPASSRAPLDGGARRGADPALAHRPALRLHVAAGRSAQLRAESGGLARLRRGAGQHVARRDRLRSAAGERWPRSAARGARQLWRPQSSTRSTR